MPRSALGGARTVVVATALLFACALSAVSLLPTAVFVIVPETAVTFTAIVNDALAPFAIDAMVQSMKPVAPNAGWVRLNPAAALIDWNVTPEPIPSVR